MQLRIFELWNSQKPRVVFRDRKKAMKEMFAV